MVKHLITLASSAGLCLLALTPCAWATAIEHDVERDQLAAVLRQLDALERHADNSAALPHPIAARYHFDYLRLREDIQRIRTGVLDYCRTAVWSCWTMPRPSPSLRCWTDRHKTTLASKTSCHAPPRGHDQLLMRQPLSLGSMLHACHLPRLDRAYDFGECPVFSDFHRYSEPYET